MAVKNTLAPAVKKQSRFPEIIKSETVQRNLIGTLGDATKTKRFTASVISAVSTNPSLQECQATTIISAALLGESLNLSPSPQLGHYYMVPFKDNKTGVTNATFQLGYKGYIQLAIRSGQYKKLNVLAIKDGELIKYDPLDETLDVRLIQDETVREKTPTIGYYAMFELVNGFRKTMYWSKEKMEEHALKYSSGYKAKKGYTFWEKDFDGMAYKTMLRQLISKWGIMSIDLQSAISNDYSYHETLEQEEAPKYVDEGTGEIIEVSVSEDRTVNAPPTPGKAEIEPELSSDEDAPSESLF